MKSKSIENAKKHPDIEFKISAGDVRLRWKGAEYRAYLNRGKFGYEEMMLGACDPESLKKYIVEERNNG